MRKKFWAGATALLLLLAGMSAGKTVWAAEKKVAKVALGSDAGAYCVPHGQGIVDEYRTFQHILGDSEDVDLWLAAGETAVKETFQTHR